MVYCVHLEAGRNGLCIAKETDTAPRSCSAACFIPLFLIPVTPVNHLIVEPAFCVPHPVAAKLEHTITPGQRHWDSEFTTGSEDRHRHVLVVPAIIPAIYYIPLSFF